MKEFISLFLYSFNLFEIELLFLFYSHQFPDTYNMKHKKINLNPKFSEEKNYNFTIIYLDIIYLAMDIAIA